MSRLRTRTSRRNCFSTQARSASEETPLPRWRFGFVRIGRLFLQRYCWLMLALGLLLPLPVLAQDGPTAIVPAEGSQVFRNLLHQRKQAPVKNISDLRDLDPRETTIILFGDLDLINQVWEAVKGPKEFQARGGAILIASDRRTSLPELRVTITGVTVRQQSAAAFHNLADCPLVTKHIFSKHPLFRGIAKGIATNKPSFLTMSPPALQVLAVHSNLEKGFVLKRPSGLAEPPFIVGTTSDSGPENRVAIIAGHSVFMNNLIALNPDNLIFAKNCVDWLTDNGRRKHVLFIEENQVLTHFRVPLTVPKPRLPQTFSEWVNFLNEAADAAEKDGIPNQLQEQGVFDNILDEFGLRHPILKMLFVGLSLLLILFGLMRFVRASFRRDIRVPLAEAWVESRQTRRPIHAQRRQTMLVQGNLMDAARDVARDWFERHTNIEQVQEHPPRVVFAKGWWERRRWQRRLDWLWELSFGVPLVRMRFRDFQNLLVEIRHLSSALAEGRFRLDSSLAPGPPPASPPEIRAGLEKRSPINL